MPSRSPEGGTAPAASAAWPVPAGWRSIEFVSDLHLCAEAPRTFAAFRRHLEATDADALFVLGDLFEVWIGDDTRERPFERECLAALAGFGARRALFFVAGNRDFLLGPQACAAARMQALPDPTCIDAFGRRLLLSHGDALCLADTDYQAFRQVVRSASWQSRFLERPLAERAALAQRIRDESQGRKSARPDPSSWADVDAAEACGWLSRAGATVLVHGHTHRPGHGSIGPGLERRVLADWDLDGDVARGSVLRLDASGWQLRPVAVAA